jgi:hypothetical protein
LNISPAPAEIFRAAIAPHTGHGSSDAPPLIVLKNFSKSCPLGHVNS